MAFITLAPLPARGDATARAASRGRAAPTMALSRRALLRGAGAALAAAGAGAALAAGGINLKDLSGELKEDVEALKYEDELFENPDAAEGLKLDTKKPKKENPVVVAEEVREQEEEAKYDAMVESEKSEAERVKALFAK
jgi:hypothetical protein